HADRLADALLRIDDEFLRQHVDDALIRGDGDGARRVDDALDIARADLFVADRDDAVRVQAAHVAARDAGVDGVDLAAGHELGFLDGALDRLHGRLDVHDDAALQAARGIRADADDLEPILGRHLAHDRNDLRGTDIETHEQLALVAPTHSVHSVCCDARQPRPGAPSIAASTAGGAAPSRQPTANPFV